MNLVSILVILFFQFIKWKKSVRMSCEWVRRYKKQFLFFFPFYNLKLFRLECKSICEGGAATDLFFLYKKYYQLELGIFQSNKSCLIQYDECDDEWREWQMTSDDDARMFEYNFFYFSFLNSRLFVLYIFSVHVVNFCHQNDPDYINLCYQYDWCCLVYELRNTFLVPVS